MIKDNRNNEQIYGRNDMVMLNPNNKIYGSLGIADKYVMKTEEGTRLVLSNPKPGKFGDVLTEFNMYGRSEQKQYKGINLLPPNIKHTEFVEASIPKGTKVFAIADGISFPGGNFKFFNADKTESMWFGLDKGATVATSTLRIDAKYVQVLLLDYKDLSKICLGIGSEPIYEPYTGSIPSPSPEYPQEIKSVVNPIVKVRGKNLFDQTKVFKYIDIGISSIVGVDCYNIVGNGEQTRRRYYLIECKPNMKYYITFVNPETNIFIGIADKNYIGIEDIIVFDDVTSVTFTTGSNAKFIVLNADATSDICISEDNADYEPYKEQSIQLPITLNAIPVKSGGNVTIDGQQYIADYVDVGHGKLVKTVYEYVFSGEERWIVAGDGSKYIERSITGNNGIMDSNMYKKCLCSCLIAGTMYETRNGENHISTQVYSDGGIVYNNRVWVSHDVVTSKLVGEKVFLALAVPKEIYLTHEEIRKFKELVTYYPITIVENNYNTWMKATYKSIESV